MRLISALAACLAHGSLSAPCNTDDGVGQQMVRVNNCKGAGCFANGVDQNCAWCVYNMTGCEKIYGTICKDTHEARRAQKAACAFASGRGAWRYRYQPDLLTLPTSEVSNDRNGHGVCKDSKGNIYFTFVPKKVDATTQVLARFDPDGTNGKMLGEAGFNGLSAGVPHGLRIEETADGAFLYHANNAQKVIKTDLDGKIVWTTDFSAWKTEKPQYWPIQPTDAIVAPGTDILVVADGYGSSFVHLLNKTTGAYLEGRSFGGKGNSTKDPVRFNTPHGIALDPRFPGAFAISDRSNNRLVWVDIDGHIIKIVPTVHPLPCNLDVHKDADAGYVGVVPSLGNSYSSLVNGTVEIYDKNTELVSTIDVAALIGYLGHQNPHDAMFLPNGDVVVCCWAGPGNPTDGPAQGTISYWKRQANSNDGSLLV
eukprot:TRINITY_DN56942_c0_g1_i1.p1 TRINITY_DN56942_c0_g1~~TRINITY_DN56942_c0_g1_i1.p1  ORF type:complete len:424 (+),score=62.33 TRINITY_DN56942_c0_g1_i1:85-1356(+)